MSACPSSRACQQPDTAIIGSKSHWTRQRAIVERAARAQGTRALIAPKVLGIAMQAGRALGWQRLIPLALLGFLAAQWVQQARREDTPDRTI
jgi:hypothetical protein